MAKAVWQDRLIEWYEMEVEEVRAADIMFNLGDANLTDNVRIIEIEGWGITACDGIHVRNMSEIGLYRGCQRVEHRPGSRPY